MGRKFALVPEAFERADDAAPAQRLPLPTDGDPSGEWVGRIDDPPAERQAGGRLTRPQRRGRNTVGDDFGRGATDRRQPLRAPTPPPAAGPSPPVHADHS